MKKTKIEKAIYSYLAKCLTDSNATKGVKAELGRELEDDEVFEVFQAIYKPFHKFYKLSK
jgi:hypothetical protein